MPLVAHSILDKKPTWSDFGHWGPAHVVILVARGFNFATCAVNFSGVTKATWFNGSNPSNKALSLTLWRSSAFS